MELFAISYIAKHDGKRHYLTGGPSGKPRIYTNKSTATIAMKNSITQGYLDRFSTDFRVERGTIEWEPVNE